MINFTTWLSTFYIYIVRNNWYAEQYHITQYNIIYYMDGMVVQAIEKYYM